MKLEVNDVLLWIMRGDWGKVARYANLSHVVFGSRKRQRLQAAVMRAAVEIALERDSHRLRKP